MDSDEMQWKFAILVDRTRESLETQKVTCSTLSVLLQHSQENKILNLTRKCKTIRKLFLKLADYWTFFDYEFLRYIIVRHCSELKSELTEYESSFKQYCKRRLCELPANVFGNTGDRNNLYVKIDRNFTTSKVKDVKKLECRLSRLLDTELCLLKVEKGCIKLTFTCLSEFHSPLSHQHIEKLKEMKITRLYSDSKEYFNSTSSSPQPDSSERGQCW